MALEMVRQLVLQMVPWLICSKSSWCMMRR